MKLVIDSSVAVKLVAPEDGQEEAYAMIRATSERVAPTLILAEAANTFWKKVGRGELSEAQAQAGVEVVADVVTRFVDEGALMPDALRMAIEISHPVYDCIYLVLAEREGCTLLTGDQRLVRKLRATPYSSLVRPLVPVS